MPTARQIELLHHLYKGGHIAALRTSRMGGGFARMIERMIAAGLLTDRRRITHAGLVALNAAMPGLDGMQDALLERDAAETAERIEQERIAAEARAERLAAAHNARVKRIAAYRAHLATIDYIEAGRLNDAQILAIGDGFAAIAKDTNA